MSSIRKTRFSSSQVWMWELDYKESWVLKNWCFWIVVLEKNLESPLDCKEIQPVHPKGDQSWVFIGRTDVEAETPILWPPDAKSWLIWKALMLGKIEGRRRRGWQRMRWLDDITDSMDMGLGNSRSWWWTGRAGVLWFMGSQRVRHDWATELNWLERHVTSTAFYIRQYWNRYWQTRKFILWTDIVSLRYGHIQYSTLNVFSRLYGFLNNFFSRLLFIRIQHIRDIPNIC